MSRDFFDLEQAVKDWAWKEYDRTATGSQKRLRQKEVKKGQKYLNLEIDWSSARFNDATRWSRLVEDHNDLGNEVSHGIDNCQQLPASSSRPASATATGQQFGQGRSATPLSSVLFETKFTNNTKDSQEYTMRTEKTTRSSIMTEIEKGLTKGCEMGIKLMTPCEVLEVNAGYKREVTLTNIEGQTFEEELTWGVESVIRVKPENVAEASLVVNERKQCGKFEIESRVSGMVYVTFTNLRDNNSFVKSTGHDIAEIVSEYKTQESRKERPLPFVRIDNDVVVIITYGVCNFRYGISQEVKVNQRPLRADDQ